MNFWWIVISATEMTSDYISWILLDSKETWDKSHSVPVIPPRISHPSPYPKLPLRGWPYASLPPASDSSAILVLDPLGLLAHSWPLGPCLGLLATPLLFLSSSPPHLPSLVAQFSLLVVLSLDPSRCLSWLFSLISAITLLNYMGGWSDACY